jgi:hypothetical protein
MRWLVLKAYFPSQKASGALGSIKTQATQQPFTNTIMAADLELPRPSEVEILKELLDEESKGKYASIPDEIKKSAFVLSRVQQTAYYSHIWLLAKTGIAPPEGRKGSLKQAKSFFCIKCLKEFNLSNKNDKPSTEQIKRHLLLEHNYSIDPILNSMSQDDLSEGPSSVPTPTPKKQKKICDPVAFASGFASFLLSHNDSYERHVLCRDAAVLSGSLPARTELEAAIDTKKALLTAELKAALSSCGCFHITIKRVKVSCYNFNSSILEPFIMVGLRFCSPEFNIVSFVLEVEPGSCISSAKLVEILQKWDLATNNLETIVVDDSQTFVPAPIASEGPHDFTSKIFPCILGFLNDKILPLVARQFGDLIYAISPGDFPGTVQILYKLINEQLFMPLPLDDLQEYVFKTLAQILKPFHGFHNYLCQKNACMGSALLAYRALETSIGKMIVVGPPDLDSTDEVKKTQAKLVLNKMNYFLSTIQNEVKTHPFGPRSHEYHYTIPLVPALSAMNGLTDAEKNDVKQTITNKVQAMQGLFSLHQANEADDYGDILSIQNQEVGGKYQYFEYYTMKSVHHTALQKCKDAFSWWRDANEEFPELGTLARTWLASTSVCERPRNHIVALVSTDNHGKYNADTTKVSVWLGSNNKPCEKCVRDRGNI